MAYLNDYVLDALLGKIQEATRLDICTAEPTTYAQATTTYSVGNKTGISIPAPTDRSPNGRKVTVPAVVATSPGTITAGGNAGYWALSDAANSRLLASGPLSTVQAVVNGNTWTIANFDVGVADPV